MEIEGLVLKCAFGSECSVPKTNPIGARICEALRLLLPIFYSWKILDLMRSKMKALRFYSFIHKEISVTLNAKILSR